MKESLSTRSALDRGVVCNWDDMERVWEHAFYDVLATLPEERPVLMTEPPQIPVVNRDRMAQTLFETFQVPAMHVAMPGVLALYAAGRTSGIALDCGHGVTHTMPIYEGFPIMHAVRKLDVAGMDVTEHLRRLLTERGGPLPSAERGWLNGLKERACYVAQDYDADLRAALKAEEDEFTLPDGQVVALGSERFRASEVLFQPGLNTNKDEGIHEILMESILNCALDVRSKLYENIVLSGGSMLAEGCARRVRRELASKAPPSMRLNVVPPKDASSVWLGGSIHASLDTSYDKWLTREEYEERGLEAIRSELGT